MKKWILEKFLTPPTFLFINCAIILTAELTGQLFFMTGAIHIIALLFITLAISRLFARYHTYDKILEKFFHASLAALFVFAISHIVEYFNMMRFNLYSDSIFANTVNFYLIGLTLITIGAEAFLRIHDNRSTLLTKFLIFTEILLAALILLFMAKKDLVSLEPDSLTPYLYVCAVAFFGLVAIKKITRIKNYVAFSRGFAFYLTTSIILLALATVPYIFYELLEDKLGVPEYQSIYMSHFIFYASLSLVFLAFGKIKVSGGLYEDIKEYKQKNHISE